MARGSEFAPAREILAAQFFEAVENRLFLLRDSSRDPWCVQPMIKAFDRLALGSIRTHEKRIPPLPGTADLDGVLWHPPSLLAGELHACWLVVGHGFTGDGASFGIWHTKAGWDLPARGRTASSG